jgi:predicted membrane-bound dolichyl-phosphate-mannose-protein mannosyltransferase
LLAHLLSVEALRALISSLSSQTRAHAGLTLFALCPIWLFDISQGAHLDVWALCFALWGVALSVQKRHLLSGLAFGVGVSVKLIPALWLGVLLTRHAWQKRWRALSVMSLSAVGAFFVCALPFMEELSNPSAWRGALAYGSGWRFNESLFGGLLYVGELISACALSLPPRALASTLLMVALLWSLWRTRDEARDDLTSALSLSAVVLLFGSPVVFSWYLGWLWALLPLLWVRLTPPPLLFSVLSSWPALLPLSYLPRCSVLSGGAWDIGGWWRCLEYLTLSLIFVIGTRYTPPQHTSERT